uniref:Uncharacterized protein n=1 Tax=Rhabditophanes sp. KR3021 TaxID=114890 RepID=A0AC35U210_9BILA
MFTSRTILAQYGDRRKNQEQKFNPYNQQNTPQQPPNNYFPQFSPNTPYMNQNSLPSELYGNTKNVPPNMQSINHNNNQNLSNRQNPNNMPPISIPTADKFPHISSMITEKSEGHTNIPKPNFEQESEQDLGTPKQTQTYQPDSFPQPALFSAMTTQPLTSNQLHKPKHDHIKSGHPRTGPGFFPYESELIKKQSLMRPSLSPRNPLFPTLTNATNPEVQPPPPNAPLPNEKKIYLSGNAIKNPSKHNPHNDDGDQVTKMDSSSSASTFVHAPAWKNYQSTGDKAPIDKGVSFSSAPPSGNKEGPGSVGTQNGDQDQTFASFGDRQGKGGGEEGHNFPPFPNFGQHPNSAQQPSLPKGFPQFASFAGLNFGGNSDFFSNIPQMPPQQKDINA